MMCGPGSGGGGGGGGGCCSCSVGGRQERDEVRVEPARLLLLLPLRTQA
jgi:hypothetical protein